MDGEGCKRLCQAERIIRTDKCGKMSKRKLIVSASILVLLVAAYVFLSDNPFGLSSGRKARDAADGNYTIGQVEGVVAIDPAVKEVSGIAFQDNSRGRFLYLLEGTDGKIHRYRIADSNRKLKDAGCIVIDGVKLENPRGLEYASESSGDVFYFMDYVTGSEGQPGSRKGILYRYDAGNNDLSSADLSKDIFDIGTGEVFGVTKQENYLYISFDPNGYGEHDTRVRRGMIRFSVSDEQMVGVIDGAVTVRRPSEWEETVAGKPVMLKHMPGPGKELRSQDTHPYASIPDLRLESSLALSDMELEGTRYLWGTVGNDYIYLLDSESGRGLFSFNRPGGSTDTGYDMIAYGAGDLWVAGKTGDNYSLFRVNVLDNPGLPYEGIKQFRDLRMRITSYVAGSVDAPTGMVYHTFCHPYDAGVAGNQGLIPHSVEVKDLTGVSDYTVEELYFDPAGDSTVRQYYTLVSYPVENHPDIRKYTTEFNVKLWKRDLKYFVYPHLACRDEKAAGTRYLEDDTVLYKINDDPDVYGNFISRVKEYIKAEYGTEADMENPYWAARNIIEYIMEQYHYPVDSAGYWATYDFAGHHYNSHPGNMKAALSEDDNYADNIVACSGVGCTVNGLLRYIGLPGLWVGTSNESYLKEGFLTRDSEGAVQLNGHRYNHVWLGKLYGWQRFDATPMMPETIEAYYRAPLKLSQWVFMERGVGSTVASKRVVQNLQSEYWDKMDVPFRSLCEGNINNCGAIRYNLLGSYTNPEEFLYSGHYLRSRGIQFIEDVNVDINDEMMAEVTWQASGDWELDPEARLNVVLERQGSMDEEGCGGNKIREVLASDIQVSQGAVTADLKRYGKGDYTITVSKEGDPAIGNRVAFELNPGD
jgi:hypothetical protein